MAGNSVYTNPNQIIIQEGQTQVVQVVTQGPQGAVGPQGPAGPTGSAEASGPIQAVQYNKDGATVSGSSLFLFDDSTGTLTLSGSFLVSGSLLPNVDSGTGISSFSLGSATNAWKDLYVGDSTIYFVSQSTVYPLTIETNDAGLVTLKIDNHEVPLAGVTGSQDITASLAVVAQTASFVSGSNVVGSVSSAITASFANTASLGLLNVLTGSVTSNTLTFTKGDGSSFNLTVDTGSAVTTSTGSLLQTASISDATITFEKGDSSTFDIVVDNVGTANTASYIAGANVDGAVVNATNAVSASYILGSNIDGTVTTATSASHAVQADTASFVATASYAVQALSASYAISASHEIIKEISSSYADTASFALLNVLTASFDQGTRNLAFTKGDSTTFNVNIPGGEVETGSLLLTGSVNSNVLTFEKADGSTFDLTVDTGSAVTTPTGSLLTTASISDATITFEKGDSSTFNIEVDNVTTANTASYIAADNIDGTVATATSASHAVQADSATTATTANTASYIAGANVDGTVANATSASYAENGGVTSIIAGDNILVSSATGDITISAVTASAAIIDTGSFYISSSISDATITFNQGDSTTESVTVNNVANATLATTANTASYVAAADIDGIVATATSASHAVQADSSLTADTPATASYVAGANVDGTVTTATTASYITGANVDGTVASATLATSASYVLGSNVDGAVANATNATNATTATTANTASYVQGANVDGTVALATSASHAVQADTASYVETAQTASYVLQAVSSSFAISASYAVSASHEIIKEVSSSYADTASLALLNVLTASVSDNTITFTKGDQTTFDITVSSDPASRTNSIITGSVTASVDVGSTNFTVDSGSSTLLSLNNTGKLTVSKSINTGVPTSNQWQENLEGSYFNNFDSNSDVSEVLRFIAGLLSASAPDASPNTKVYNSITENKSNTSTSTIRAGYVPQDNTNSDIDYLISQGFASEGGTLFPGKTLYSNSSYSISYSSVAGGSTNVSSSNDSQLFGLGVLTSGGPTDFNVSGTINWFYSDNNSKTQTDVSQSENLLTQNSFGTSNGLTLGKIETANPSVIPAAYQDGKFAAVYSSGLYNGGRSFTNVSSSGWYQISASIAIASGSSDYSPLKAATEEIFWAPVSTINGNIANSSPSFTGAGTEPLTATSRSLSGAPYLQTATWALSSSVSDLFDPVYASSTTISRILDDSSFVSLSGTTSVSTNGGTVQTSNAIFDSTGTTARNTGTVPFRTDIIKLTGSATFNAGTSDNINQTGLGDNNFGLTTYARNNNSSEINLNSFNTTYHAAGTFGQPSASGSMGYYGQAQGYDPGTLTGGSETFFGEDFRMDISDNLLSGSYANGDNWDTTFQVENLLGDLDLQVKPGFLVKPGGTYKYWLPDRSSEDYRFYARAFQRSSATSAASITLTISTSAAAVNWDSTSTGLGIAILMESVGVDVQSTARLLDVTDTISNVISTGVSNDNHQNPFTPDIDLYGNSGGSFTDSGSTLTATVPVRNADGFFLNGTYQDLIIILRYKGDISPVTNISISYS